jgi:hypothetical protein
VIGPSHLTTKMGIQFRQYFLTQPKCAHRLQSGWIRAYPTLFSSLRFSSFMSTLLLSQRRKQDHLSTALFSRPSPLLRFLSIPLVLRLFRALVDCPSAFDFQDLADSRSRSRTARAKSDQISGKSCPVSLGSHIARRDDIALVTRSVFALRLLLFPPWCCSIFSRPLRYVLRSQIPHPLL